MRYFISGVDVWNLELIFWFLVLFGPITIFSMLPLFFAIKNAIDEYYLKVHNKKILMFNEVFRDLPFKYDYYKAYYVANEYNLMRQNTDFLGAIILKWIKDDNVRVIPVINKKSEEKDIEIELIKEPKNEFELRLYEMMMKASKDGILRKNELKKYCRTHASSFLSWFDGTKQDVFNSMRDEGKYIYEKEVKRLFGKKDYKYMASDELNEKATQMAGLQKFLNNFGFMGEKRSIEVKLWREYLIYAQIFGIAEEVAREFKRMYPDIITDDIYDDILNINVYIHDVVRVANNYNRGYESSSAADSYSSGGGGFSSGGGGGGSFGGGGGGGGFR